MMNTNINSSNNIPEIGIRDYQKKSSGLLVLNLDEVINNFQLITTNPHRTCYYQLLLITKGNGTIWIDSNKYELQSKLMIVVSKGQIAAMDFSDDVKGSVLLFSEEYIYKQPEDLAWINNLLLFDLSISPPVIKLSDDEYNELLAMINKINSEMITDEDFAKDEILFNMLKTFLLFAERIKRTGICSSLRSDGGLCYLTEFRKKLEENYSSSRSVLHFAKLLNITPKRLNQITTAYLGKTAKRIIEERVLLETKRLLVHSNLTVKEIGHSLGFNDPANLNKFFKRYEKTTPVNFRISSKKTHLYN